jgi:hypothetical protein
MCNISGVSTACGHHRPHRRGTRWADGVGTLDRFADRYPLAAPLDAPLLRRDGTPAARSPGIGACPLAVLIRKTKAFGPCRWVLRIVIPWYIDTALMTLV